MSAFAYLDHNATSPLRPAAFDAMVEVLRIGGNPSAVHSVGRKARSLVDTARRQVAALVGCLPAEIVFTSGGTEANNMALAGTGRRRVLVSAIEHESVLRAVPDGQIRLRKLDRTELSIVPEHLSTADQAFVAKIRAYTTVAKLVAILSHLAVVVGMIAVGFWHFNNVKMGVGAATLYLMLPYTSQMTGRVDHVLGRPRRAHGKPSTSRAIVILAEPAIDHTGSPTIHERCEWTFTALRRRALAGGPQAQRV